MKPTSPHLAAAFLLTSLTSSHAATVAVDKIFENLAVDMQAGLNDGGIDANANTQYANGVQELSFRLLIDDSGDTGATFEATMTFAGTTWGGDNEVSTNPAGRVVFVESADTTRNQTLTITIGSITQTGGPAANANFDGFTFLSFDQFSVAADVFSFDGTTYTGDVDGPGGTATGPVTLDSLAPSGSTVLDIPAAAGGGAGQFRMAGVGTQFTVTDAVPEPSVMGFTAMLGLLLVRRQRRP